MKTKLCHIEINASDLAKSGQYYRELARFFEPETPDFTSKNGYGIAFIDELLIVLRQVEEKYKDRPFHRKAAGLNHLCFWVHSRGEVDRFMGEFLKNRGDTILYGGPKEYPQYGEGYYAVYFEDPDRIKLEIAYYPDPESEES